MVLAFLRMVASALGVAMVLAFGLGASGCATTTTAAYSGQRVFHSPRAAAEALHEAAEAGDTEAMLAIFGPDGEAMLSSGDPVSDAYSREVFVVAMRDSWDLAAIDSTTRELVVGPEAWPFPAPLVRDGRGWWFDTDEGLLEIRARRIGRNELATIAAMQAYFVAQVEYASEGRDGGPAGVYAQRIVSEAGRQNGLYWPVEEPDAPASPLSEFAAGASAEGYTGAGDGGAPFRGYFYRPLMRQGDAALGGAMEYVVDGAMTEGFALLAWPAEYGNSGIMSFLVGPDGVVYEADLGEETAAVAEGIDSYNPDPVWSAVE